VVQQPAVVARTMETEVKDFLRNQRVGCLAVALEDGTPHTSAVHFSCDAECQRLFFQVGKGSRKFNAVNERGKAKASFTIGFSEKEWKTLQIDGDLRLLRVDEDEQFQKIHYLKNPEAKQYRGEDTAYLVFEPIWWRFSDFSVGDPPRIIGS